MNTETVMLQSSRNRGSKSDVSNNQAKNVPEYSKYKDEYGNCFSGIQRKKELLKRGECGCDIMCIRYH